MSDVPTEVNKIFDLLASEINPEAARGLDAVIQFNLTGAGGGSRYVEVKDGTCKITEGTHPSPKLTMNMSAADYVDMFQGKLNGQMAFMNGKLKIVGDMGLAMKMQTLFKRPT
jgi:putative sterol carrier protein